MVVEEQKEGTGFLAQNIYRYGTKVIFFNIYNFPNNFLIVNFTFIVLHSKQKKG